jgi:decaprenylphospho-beta-D-ribofuranose 2-oxidase
MIISGWGNYPRVETRLRTPQDGAAFTLSLKTEGPGIARGAGRAYGDAAIGSNTTLSTRHLDRMIAFDPATAEATVEAGVLLADIIDVFLPRGFFPPVVPGTRFVTIGGMVAANVHGKNHHLAGGFGRHIQSLTLITADGSQRVCSPTENAQLFRATIGGMGLTGIIRDVTFRLIPVETGLIRQETIVVPNLDAVMRIFEESRDWTYTAAWIDGLARGASLGRSVLFRGEHALNADLPPRADPRMRPLHPPKLSVPVYLPNVTLNRLSVRAFNALYLWYNRSRAGTHLVPLASCFFPLDTIANWNRIYGRQGFLQYQCVIPQNKSRDALGEILEIVGSRGSPSFLAVLKLLGPDEAGMMAFPMDGYTLALDFPASEKSFHLCAELDSRVLAHGGRIYFAKDARQNRNLVEAGYPNLAAFRELRRQSGAASRFGSLQSERLGL